MKQLQRYIDRNFQIQFRRSQMSSKSLEFGFRKQENVNKRVNQKCVSRMSNKIPTV